MSILVVPLTQDLPWYTFTTSLDGISYTLEVQYNVRSERWYMSIADAIGTPVVSGIPLLINRDLLAPYRTYDVPAGGMVVIDNTGADAEPTLDSFLTTHALYYVEPGT